jgi:hypothetical protein
MKTFKHGCPICQSDVTGDKEHLYYCKKCNVLFREEQIGTNTIGIEREPGYLYFIDKQGDVSRVKMARSRSDKGPKKHEKVEKFGIQKEKGYLYYLDKNGFVARKLMKRRKKGEKYGN